MKLVVLTLLMAGTAHAQAQPRVWGGDGKPINEPRPGPAPAKLPDPQKTCFETERREFRRDEFGSVNFQKVDGKENVLLCWKFDPGAEGVQFSITVNHRLWDDMPEVSRHLVHKKSKEDNTGKFYYAESSFTGEQTFAILFPANEGGAYKFCAQESNNVSLKLSCAQPPPIRTR